jgi:hypothetical protein
MASAGRACGWLAILSGTAALLPVATARSNTGEFSDMGLGVGIAAGVLIVAGAFTLRAGWHQQSTSVTPPGVRAAIAAYGLFVAFFVLELSDRLVQRDGQLHYWSTWLLPPTLALFTGLVAGRRWAWWTARGLAVCGVLWFLGFVALIPFVPLQTNGVPVPWYGRVYMTGVTLLFAGVLAGAFRSLGRWESRTYFGIGDSRPERRDRVKDDLNE